MFPEAKKRVTVKYDSKLEVYSKWEENLEGRRLPRLDYTNQTVVSAVFLILPHGDF